jgi:hypothetical protein
MFSGKAQASGKTNGFTTLKSYEVQIMFLCFSNILIF